ncbi:MAG: thrombospondin type 3 repeat-containing protein [Dehalococcoidia bacterium]|nr:thrombospondin type 3 repeat-containing protein [Dehalococcoidia bacterium]
MNSARRGQCFVHVTAFLLIAAIAVIGGDSPVRAQTAFPLETQSTGSADCNPASVAMILQWYQTTGQVGPETATRYMTPDGKDVLHAFQKAAGKTSGPYSTAHNAEAVRLLAGEAVTVQEARWPTRAEAERYLETQVGAGNPVQVFVGPKALRYLPYSTAGWPGAHSIVVHAIDRDSISYADPWTGESQSVTRDEFDRLYRYVFIDGSATYASFVYTPSRPALRPPSDFVVKEDINARSGFGFAIDATWKDNSSDEDGFQLYYRADGKSTGKTSAADANSTRARISGIAFDDVAPEKNRVCYWVVATRNGIESARSNEWCIDRLSVWNPNAEPPGGVWVEAPASGSPVSGDSLRVSARAYPDKQSGPKIDRVEFTLWWPAVGPSSGPWTIGCSQQTPVAGDLYRCDIDLRQIPAGEFRLSFDVYDAAGYRRLSPNGVRNLTRPGTSSGDVDSDGIADGSDRCPTQAEDRNGYEDSDGCPDGGNPDPDGDGITGSNDRCPTQAEDRNGYEDSDGCPDGGNPDPDGDGITGSNDRCPTQAEDRNGYEDSDGCPDGGDPDPDGDGIKGSSDTCPTQAEDFNGYEDSDGCPEGGNPDPDGDGIKGSNDKCPNQAENFNGYEDSDGCPETPPVNYTLTLDLLDWTDGATFIIGDRIGFCYSLTPANVPFGIRLYKSSNGGSWEFISDWADSGGGGCLWVGTVSAPAGTRTYLAQAIVNGQVVAEDTTWIRVQGGGGGNPPTGSCDRAPSTPTNFRLNGNTLSWDVTDPGGSGCILEYEVNTFGGQNLYRGSTPSFTLPSTSCNSGYFVGARNQKFGYYYYALWTCPN